MRLLSGVWSSVNGVARLARDLGLIGSTKLPVTTIGIGNVQAGGTGKTPLTIRLARDAVAAGMKVAVLTRGYRGAWEKTGGIVTPEGRLPSPDVCGDEAALIRDQVPGVWLGVGADRVSQFGKLVAAARAQNGRIFDLVLLDDAFQHWKIRCDRYVVAVTDTPYGNRLFRDTYASIRDEDLVVLTKGEAFPAGLENHRLRARSEYFVPPGKPGLRYRFVAALGDPDRARILLEKSGYSISSVAIFPDHYRFTAENVKKIRNEADSEGSTILLTGKDWVKWRSLGVSPGAVAVVEPEVRFLEGEALWRGLFTV
jgi:tetraacyldisaccharide 4'-kinase